MILIAGGTLSTLPSTLKGNSSLDSGEPQLLSELDQPRSNQQLTPNHIGQGPEAQATANWAEIGDVRVPIPPGWTFNRQLAAKGGPISLTNFGGAYARGGVIPPLGAELEITSVPKPAEIMEYIRTELRGVRELNIQQLSAGDNSAIRASYRDLMGTDVDTTTVVYYVPHSSNLYKFYLSYRTANANGKNLESLLGSEVREAALR